MTFQVIVRVESSKQHQRFIELGWQPMANLLVIIVPILVGQLLRNARREEISEFAPGNLSFCLANAIETDWNAAHSSVFEFLVIRYLKAYTFSRLPNGSHALQIADWNAYCCSIPTHNIKFTTRNNTGLTCHPICHSALEKPLVVQMIEPRLSQDSTQMTEVMAHVHRNATETTRNAKDVVKIIVDELVSPCKKQQ